jgi:type IX secretion system PorP/SprF family membrane protein
MKKVAHIVLLVLIASVAHAQNSQFSQYFAASLYLNPAFNGIYNNPSIHMNHKRQAQDAEAINELTQVSLIFPVKPQGKLERSIGGAGIMLYSENSGPQGIQTINSAFLNYAHNLKFGVLSSYVISFGLQVGYEQRSVNFANFRSGSQYNPFLIDSGFDPTLPNLGAEFNEQSGSPIVNFGAMYHYNPDRNYLLYKYNAFAGISVTNLNRPDISSAIDGSGDVAPMQWKYHGGIEYKINKVFFTPNLLLLYIRQNYQFNAGFNVTFSPNANLYAAQGTSLLFGSYYRFRDSFIFMGGVQFQSFTIRGSYDMNSKVFVQDRLVDIAQNSFEISIQYSLAPKTGLRKLSNPLF